MRITKTTPKTVYSEGDKFVYTFLVKNVYNLDNTAAYNVLVEDTFPVGVSPTGSYTISPSRPGNSELWHDSW